MANQTDLALPLTPAKFGRAVGAIVERAFPSPREENCMRVGEMERALTALCGEAVQLAYNDAAGIARDARERLAKHLWVADAGAPDMWDRIAGRPYADVRNPYYAQADVILAVISGREG